MEAQSSAEAAPKTIGDGASRTRPWYRLHRSTWIGMLLFACVLAVIIVPGETQSGGSSGRTAFLFLQHGWPWPYLERCYQCPPGIWFDNLPQFSAFPHVPEWMTSWAWSFGSRDVFRPISLSLDALSAGCLLLVLAVALESRRRRRRITQWTLRELLAATMLVACFFAYWRMSDARRAEEQRDLTRLRELAERPGVSFLPCSADYVGPLWLRRLAGPLPAFWAQRCVFFSKHGPSFTEADLAPFLPGLARLRYLNWITIESDNNVDESTYRSIANMPQVSRLEIRAPKNSIKISGRELRHLAEMQKLSSLELNHCAEVRDSAILGRLTNLERLTIMTPSIDDPQLSFLVGMTNLRRLELDSVPCDDRAIENIARLRGLETLEIIRSAISPEGMDRLRTALPRCNTALCLPQRTKVAAPAPPAPAAKP